MLVSRQPVSRKLLEKSNELLRLLSLGGTPASDGQPRDDSFERHEESQVDPHSLSARPSGDASDLEHSTVENTASADGRDVPAGAVRQDWVSTALTHSTPLCFPCLSPLSVLELSQTAGSVPMTSGTERSKPDGEIKQFSVEACEARKTSRESRMENARAISFLCRSGWNM